MRQLIKIFLILVLASLPAYSAVQGKLEYTIPIDYSKLSREELDTKAGFYYNLAIKTASTNSPLTPTLSQRGERNTINSEMTAALNLYKILQSQNPDNTFYNIRLGHLYDLIGLDKYAKGCFFQAIGCDETQAEPYFRLGNFITGEKSIKKH